MKRSETMGEIAKALSAFQGELKPIQKDETATANKYSWNYLSLPAVLEMALPLLSKHGLALVQASEQGDDGLYVTTMLLHTSGEYIENTLRLAIVSTGSNAIHAAGSAITYARRYEAMALLGIAADDTDAADITDKDIKPTKRRTQSSGNSEPKPESKKAESTGGGFATVVKLINQHPEIPMEAKSGIMSRAKELKADQAACEDLATKVLESIETGEWEWMQ